MALYISYRVTAQVCTLQSHLRPWQIPCNLSHLPHLCNEYPELVYVAVVGATSERRFSDDDDDDAESSPTRKRLALEVQSPTGTKVVHIDPQSYVAQPLDLITDPYVTEIQAHASSYISRFMTYNKRDGFWFPVALVPDDQSWVVVDENPLVMHRAHEGKPLMIWIVGSFINLSLHPALPGMHSTLEVTVDLLREHDRSQLTAIHNSAATIPMAAITTFKVTTPPADDYGPPCFEGLRRGVRCKIDVSKEVFNDGPFSDTSRPRRHRTSAVYDSPHRG
ncbi:hypothetical protein L226DRAFT_521844 [Lentinus tigrinus ALCF2SS1-7]|uniref:uncharacterized protein n=1 Tax=Lentinus tigrinus ALCF2SS1-7 TaxID=1328758 RepID=UPI00116608FC|nr:hypothetical protein L226DRAFT_521844 [Lentinus tigrinus ALCF2SS1-7]